MKLTRQEVYWLIDNERDYQDTKWNHHGAPKMHTPTEWLVYIQDYLTEAMNIISRTDDAESNEKVMANIRKIGGMCVAAMEQNGAPDR